MASSAKNIEEPVSKPGYCNGCGGLIKVTAKFCQQCGAHIPARAVWIGILLRGFVAVLLLAIGLGLGYLLFHSAQTHSASVATTLPPKTSFMSESVTVGYGEVNLPTADLLCGAAARGDMALVEKFVAAGQDLNGWVGEYRWAPLHWAAWKGSDEVTNALLKAGANPQYGDEDGMSPLHIAAMCGHVGVIGSLLAHGADIEVRDRWGCTPLHHAVLSNQKEAATYLIAKGAKLNAQDEDGNTPLSGACVSGIVAMTETLLVAGANTSIRNVSGDTALARARRSGRKDVVELLLRSGVKE